MTTELRGMERRAFLKWSGLVAALLGLDRTRYLESLHGLGGVALADGSSKEARINYSLHFVAGNGGLANWTLAFPMTEVAKTANAVYSSHAPGKGVKATNGDPTGELYYSPEAAAVFNAQGKTRQMTAFLANNNQTHSGAPQAMIGQGASMIATCAAIQTASSALLPAIGVNAALYGTAPGAPAIAGVANAQGLVDLFNSAAAQTLLKTPDSANLMEKYHKAFLGLNRTSASPIAKRHFDGSKVAVNLLGKQMADLLRPTAAEQAMFGIDAMAPNNIRDQANSAITALKAFSLGLTRMLVLPSFNNDPHGMFAAGDATALATSSYIAKLFDGIFKLGDTLTDPKSGKKLSDKLVVTVHGDTMKNPFQRGGWPDGTPQNTNVMYVLGQGYIKQKWFGGFPAGTTPMAYNPETGATVAMADAGAVTGANAFASASAAVAFAVSGGDMAAVNAVYRGPSIAGLVNSSLTG